MTDLESYLSVLFGTGIGSDILSKFFSVFRNDDLIMKRKNGYYSFGW